MRLFVAVDLDDTVRKNIQDVESELASKHNNQNFVKAENLHFTLKFLGEVDEKDVTPIGKGILAAVEASAPFDLRVSGMGRFGSRKFARIVWVGVREGREEMARLSAALEKSLSKFRPAGKSTCPHITICRAKGNTAALMDDVEKLKARDFGVLKVGSIKQKSSELNTRGAVYKDIAEFRLGS